MKSILASALVFITTLAFSQTKIDENVKVKFPAKPDKSIETEVGRRIIDYVVENDSEYYVVEKFEYTTDTYGDFSKDKAKRQLYLEFFESMAGEFNSLGFEFTDSQAVEIQGYYAYQFIFESEEEGYTSVFKTVMVDEDFYAFGYTGPTNQPRNRQLFFESIWINPDAEKGKNFTKSWAFKLPAIIISVLIVTGLILIFRRQAQKHKESEQIKLE